MRTNYFIWSGVPRHIRGTAGMDTWDDMPSQSWRDVAGMYPTVVIDMDLASWALPFAIHAGGPLLGKPGFHFRIGPVNIGWSKL